MTTIGIVGAGAITREHVAAYRRIPGVRISHVADLDGGRAAELAALAGGAAPTTDARALFAAPEIDAVDICTASGSHAALTIAAARAGKHVHVEKPAALALAVSWPKTPSAPLVRGSHTGWRSSSCHA